MGWYVAGAPQPFLDALGTARATETGILPLHMESSFAFCFVAALVRSLETHMDWLVGNSIRGKGK